MSFWNAEREELKKPSLFRKISMGNWGKVGDPQVYGLLELDCEKTVAYLEKLRKETGARVTVNHLVGRIMALVLHKYPQLNGIIANGRIYIRKDVDIFFQVGLEDAETELVGICVRNVDRLGIVEFAKHIIQKSEEVRSSKHHPIRKAQNPFQYIPWRMIPFAIRFLNWLQYDLNLNLAWLGIPKDAFGSLMITAVGSLGQEFIFVPLTHLGRTPVQLAVGKIFKKAVVLENDEIVPRSRLNLCCTFDHRFIDGILGAKMAGYFRELFEHPDVHADLLEGKIPPEEPSPSKK